VDDLRNKLNRLMFSTWRSSGDRTGEAPVRDRGGSVGGSEGDPSIRERLARLGGVSPSGGVAPRGGTHPPRGRLEERLGGSEQETPFGPLFVVDSSYRCGYRHGDHRLDSFHHIDRETMDTFCGGGGGLRGSLGVADFLFLDLETTGLSLGAGTYAFLVGMGFFREGTYRIRQVFMRSFEEEPCMMSNLRRWFEPFGALVTFNGKRFDVPLLETRFCMFGEPFPWNRDQRHWDLLYPVRRLWKERQEDCRLSTMEKRRLGVARQGADVPGSRIPEIYYRYVHEGETTDLDRILYHNAMDILTLTTLAVEIDRSVKELDPERVDVVSVGRFFESKGHPGRGRACYEIVAGGAGGPEGERDEALYRLALRLKREGRWEEAVPIWSRVAEQGRFRVLESCEELAKVYEHETREWEKAIEVVEMAMDIVSPADRLLRGRLDHRLRRLRRKAGEAGAR